MKTTPHKRNNVNIEEYETKRKSNLLHIKSISLSKKKKTLYNLSLNESEMVRDLIQAGSLHYYYKFLALSRTPERNIRLTRQACLHAEEMFP